MIVKVARKRRTGRGSFISLKEYLERDREDCIASWSRGVANHDTADLEMERCAAHRKGVTDPVYHLVTSFRPGEIVDVETARRVESALLRALDADEHQSFSAIHFDSDREVYHVHTGVNRIHPVTGKVLSTWRDHSKLAGAAEWCEREYGLRVDRRIDWRKIIGERDFALEVEDLAEARSVVRGLDREAFGSTEARDARRRTHYSWTEILRREITPAINDTIAKPNATWADVHAAMRSYGVKLQERGSGFQLVGAEKGQHVKASQIGIDAAALRERLGDFTADEAAGPSFNDRVCSARDAAATWRTWDEAHAQLRALDLAIRDRGGKRGQLIDLTGDGRVPLSRSRSATNRDAVLGESLPELEARLGVFSPAPEIMAREQREHARQVEGLEQRAAMLAADPATIVLAIAENHATWERADVTRAVRAKLGVDRDDDRFERLVEIVADAVLRVCEPIDVARTMWTTSEIRAEEEALFRYARELAESNGAPKIRAASASLDDQQRAAYDHLASQNQLAIVTGIAGSGKSYLQKDLADAYHAAGARVIGTAVASDAARVLAESADIPAVTTAKLLYDLRTGREALGPRDVILIDEAGTLGSAQARELLERARDAGATVRLLGDESQHESVGRGAVLRGLVRDHGAADMDATRRARHDWLRKANEDLRDGRVAPALAALREHRSIRAYKTQSEAKAYLVGQYVAGAAAGRSALVIADSNADVADLNEAVQRRLADEGRLGEPQTYQTAYGATAFRIGDVVAIREAKLLEGRSRWINGDRAIVVGHISDGIVRVRRERDAEEDEWDVRENPAIQLGYATTSHRSQGRTVDDVYLLPSNTRRGTYVDVSRARDTVTIAYGEDAVSDFGQLMYRAQAERSKTLVRDSMPAPQLEIRELDVQLRPEPGIGRRFPDPQISQPGPQIGL